MNKDRYQSTSARRALALLNSPQVSETFSSGGCFRIFWTKKVTRMCPKYLLTRYYKRSSQYQTLIKIDPANSLQYYTIIDFNEVDIRIYLPEKVIIH